MSEGSPRRRKEAQLIAAEGGCCHATEGGTDIGVDPASVDVPCNWRTASIRAATESVDDSPSARRSSEIAGLSTGISACLEKAVFFSATSVN